MSAPQWTIEDIYVHPQSGATVVHVSFDFGLLTNINIPAQMLEGLTKEEIEDVIERHIQRVYEDRKQSRDPTQKQKVEDAIKELKEKHKKP